MADPLDEALDHDRVARFGADLAKLWPEGTGLGLAVSGGPDSLALLILANAVTPGRVEAATVDHGLRPESAGEAALVEKYCAELGVKHETLSVTVPAGNLQDAARGVRYRVLGQWAKQRGLGAIATGHHADDQAETLLMRLNRGSGVPGLAGVRARGKVVETEIPILRPLLSWRRTELATIVEDAGWTAVSDPSNVDDQFDRARIRTALLEAEWINVPALAASASHIAEGEEALVWAATREWDEAVQVAEGEIRYRPKAPRAIRLRVMMRAIGMLGGNPRGGSIGLLMRRLQAGKDATLAGCVVRVEGDEWIFRKEPPRRVQGPL